MIEIIESENRWNSVVDSCQHSDFYHTYDYHELSKGKSEEPLLIKYEEDGQMILIPLLIRNIEGTTYRDLTSVYGYPGPLTKNISPSFDNSKFKKNLHELFYDNKIVSVFSRLNPLIPLQKLILNGLGEIIPSGKVINIDLTLSLEEQRRQYQRRVKSYINKSRKLCRVREARTEEDLYIFIDMYYENMARVNAMPRYFFKEKYFFDLFNSKHFKTDILLATENKSNTIIGGAMFIKRKNIIQYHLSGSKEEFLFLNPIKLMIDEMRIMGTSQNYSYFNLGGGVGSNEDSLFKFKSNFSKDKKVFNLWKYIVNQDMYDILAKDREKNPCFKGEVKNQNFFPFYRCEK